MEPLPAAILGLVQGLTEFLPVSSSGHLVLVPRLFGWSDQSLAFDVAVHVGTLFAVALYFRAEVLRMFGGFIGSVAKRSVADPDAYMAWGLIIATVPAVIVGGVIRLVLEVEFNSPLLVATNLVIFAVLLLAADLWMRGQRNEGELRWPQYLLLGCAQAMALLPGTSRSGITITAGLAMGLTRVAAARISFLMALPAIGCAGALELLKLLLSSEPVAWLEMGIGLCVAFVSGIACIHFLLQLLQRSGFLPFVIYRLVLGAWIFYLFL